MSKIIIMGPGGSGKTTLGQRFIDRGFEPGLLHTTRPQREGEPDNSYIWCPDEAHFFDKQEEENNPFVFKTKYGDWWYGLSQLEYQKDLQIAWTPDYLKQLKENGKYERTKWLIIYLNIDIDIRRARLQERSDITEGNRRLASDEETWKNFKDYDVVIRNSNF